jgi:hypothetical protein
LPTVRQKLSPRGASGHPALARTHSRARSAPRCGGPLGCWLLYVVHCLLVLGYWLLAGKASSTTTPRGHDHPLRCPQVLSAGGAPNRLPLAELVSPRGTAVLLRPLADWLRDCSQRITSPFAMLVLAMAASMAASMAGLAASLAVFLGAPLATFLAASTRPRRTPCAPPPMADGRWSPMGHGDPTPPWRL